MQNDLNKLFKARISNMQNTFLFRRLWQTKWNKIMKFSKLYSLGFQMIHHGDCHMKFFRIKQCCYCWLIVGSFPFKFLRTKMTPIKVKNKFTILKSTVWISVHQKLRTSTVDVPFWAHSFFWVFTCLLEQSDLDGGSW